MMDMTMDMMRVHEAEAAMPDMDMALMAECIEACSACEQACTMCASCMMGDGTAMHMEMCMNTADMANTMMRMMLRPSGMMMDSMIRMLDAMMVQARGCADECMKHADMHEDCQVCAEACRQCEIDCSKMMDSMKEMMA
jgi:hypothetical protein